MIVVSRELLLDWRKEWLEQNEQPEDGRDRVTPFDVYLYGTGSPSEVTQQLIARDTAGRQKYGTTLDRTDLTTGDWLQHMAEEQLDAAGYALAAKREWERGQAVFQAIMAYVMPHLDAGTFAAPAWAIHLGSLLTGGDGAGAFPTPNNPSGYCVQGRGANHASGGFSSLLIDGVEFDAQSVARRMLIKPTPLQGELRQAVAATPWADVPEDKLRRVADVLCDAAPAVGEDELAVLRRLHDCQGAA